MLIFNDVSDTIGHLGYVSLAVNRLKNSLSTANNIDEKTIAENLKEYERVINLHYNEYCQSRTDNSQYLEDVLPQISKLETDFAETMNLLHPLSDTKITKLQTIIGSIQELVFNKIPRDSEEYKHLQKNFPGKL